MNMSQDQFSAAGQLQPATAHPEPRGGMHLHFGSLQLFFHWSFIPVLIWMFGINVREEYGWFSIVWGLFFFLVLLISLGAQAAGELFFARVTGGRPASLNIYPLTVLIHYREGGETYRHWPGLLAGFTGNLMIALVLYPFIHHYLPYWDYSENIGGIGLPTLLFQLQFLNLFLFLINLFPVWPLKGGQFLERFLDRFWSLYRTQSVLKALSILTGSVLFYFGILLFEPALGAIGLLCLVMTRYRLYKSVSPHPFR